MANFGLYDLSPLSGDPLEYASSVEVSPCGGQDGSILKSYLIQGHEESSTLNHGGYTSYCHLQYRGECKFHCIVESRLTQYLL